MKRVQGLAAAAVMAMMAVSAGAQTSTVVKDDLFAGTEIFSKNATDVNEITMDPGTLGMVDGKDSKRAHNMVLSVVRTYSYDKPGMYRIEDVDAFRNKLNTGDWHCSVHTRSMKTGESTDVCNKQRTDDMKETAIITVEPKQLTFIHTIGKTSSSSWSGGSWGSGPGMSFMAPGMGFMMDPAMQAEMAISQAEMHAQMAEMRASPAMAMAMARINTMDMPKLQMQVDKAIKVLPKLENFDSAAMQKKLDDALKSLDDANKSGAAKQPE